MNPPLNTSRVTVLPMRAKLVPAVAPALLSPMIVPQAAEARSATIPSDKRIVSAVYRPPGTGQLSFWVAMVGHVVSGVLGLALGYYLLCCLRPAEFNTWQLPVPRSSSVTVDTR